MGKQSLPHPPRTEYFPRRIALFLLLYLLSLSNLFAQTPSVSALTIPLILPSAVAFDAAGNLYFAETGNHVIRKVDTVGNITTIAGTGTQGFSGDTGPGTSATLDSPQGLALDTAGNLYIADTHNQRIRKLNLTTGIITTIAGSTAGFSGDGASALAAQLNLPTALALDASSDLYIADTSNHHIRKLNLTTSIITTIAGNGTQGYSGDSGPATLAAIDSPTGIAVDASNNLYLADTHNHRVRKIAATTGIITTIAGTGSPGFSGDTAAATAANLALPHGLTADSAGNLYLADTANHRIRRIDATTGIITTVVGDGTQAFAGDNGPPTAASLDSPTATTLSPASNLTLSDTGNERIRQVVTQPASTTITTIAGLGPTTSGALSLTAPPVIVYGTGQITASLSTTPATGSVTFLETTNGTTKTLGSSPLVSNTATLSTSTLPAGAYNLTATYSGDQTHPSAQSVALALTITPHQLTATVAPISLLYDQPIPNITGTLNGILPQDAANLTASFTTTATVGSPVGIYSITPVLAGSAAGNYTVATSALLTIHPAATVITLSNLVASGTTGSAITLTVHVASTTNGTPPGSVTLLDGNSPLFTTALSPSGDAVFLTTSLAQGSHTFTAVYDGSANFTPSISAPQLITVGTGSPTSPDFALSATGTTTQTILSGASTSFTFAVQMQNNLSSPITLAATGLPNLATASFNPAYLPPGGTPNTFTMTIATPKTTATNNSPRSLRPQPFLAAIFLLSPIAGLAFHPRKRGAATKFFLLTIAGVTLLLASGCGDRIKTDPALTSQAKTYSITVTGTATGPAGNTLQHTATVTLVLNPAS
jgi:sugar lactone lactonase YvrE